MNRMVWCVFKAIALSMIFVFVWDMGFYLYRTFSLNQRMEMLMSSMTKVVQENNYLPENEAKVYETLFKNLAGSMNVSRKVIRDINGTATGTKGKVIKVEDNETEGDFVNGFQWNYHKGSKGTVNYTNSLLDINADVTDVNGNKKNRNVLVRYMDKSACYGDIMVCYVSVYVNTPFWTFQTGKDEGRYNLTTWTRNFTHTETKLDYVYYVPCMNYTSITQ